MAKDHTYGYEIYKEWKAKIPKKDMLREEKKKRLRQAIDLCYGEETYEGIVNATTEMQIYKAMVNGRENCA